MKKSPILSLCLLGMICINADAQVPSLVHYQGRVVVGGTNFTGSGQFKFALVATNTGYWSHDGSGGGSEPTSAIALPVDKGLFSVLLGDTSLTNMSVLPPSVFTNEDVRLRVWFSDGVSGFQQLTPDQRIAAVGYALNAATAQGVADGGVTAVMIADNAVTGEKISTGSITSTLIASNTITSANIADNTIILADVTSNTFWQTTGNSGIQENVHFLGTTQKVPLEFRVNNSRVAQFRYTNGASVIILGSEANEISEGTWAAAILGGSNNVIGTRAKYSVIGGGVHNELTFFSEGSVVAGGLGNKIYASEYTAIAGGVGTLISNGSYSAIVGGNICRIESEYAFIGAGNQNRISSNSAYSVLVGGTENKIEHGAGRSAILGGLNNTIGIDSLGASIGGGENNSISSNSPSFSVVGGGRDNDINYGTENGTISGGQGNKIGFNSSYSTVVGGYSNVIGSSVNHSAILGGRENRISNNVDYAFAAGRRAVAAHSGTLVLSDGNSSDLISTNGNSVTMRASGGYRLFSNSGMSLGAQLAPNATSWSALSDRNAKENITPINPDDILDKVASLPLSAWTYKSDPNHRRYIGPMAQDFHAAFELGDEKTINTLDTDGVALAAIQALNAKLERENAALRAEMNAIRKEMMEYHQQRPAKIP